MRAGEGGREGRKREGERKHRQRMRGRITVGGR